MLATLSCTMAELVSISTCTVAELAILGSELDQLLACLEDTLGDLVWFVQLMGGQVAVEEVLVDGVVEQGVAECCLFGGGLVLAPPGLPRFLCYSCVKSSQICHASMGFFVS